MQTHQTPKSIWAFLLLAGGFLCFFQLGKSPINQWDESRLAINALEMWHRGFDVVTTYGGEPDHWNTKPPLLIWLQTASFHTFGPSEWSFRLPSALAALLLGLVLYTFARRISSNALWAILVPVVLWSTPGFMRMHVGRSGDYDALLSLWVVSGVLLFYVAVVERRWRLLPVVFLCFGLAVWTKGIAGALMGPALVLFALWQRQLVPMLKSRWLWLGLLLWLAMVGGIYGWRMAADPGYLEALMREEWGGRYGRVILGSGEGPWYYLTLFFDFRQYSYWMLFFLAGLFVSPGLRKDPLKQFVLLCTLILLTILSKASTKFDWYQAPLYPLMALVTASSLHALLSLRPLRPAALRVGAALLLVAYPLGVVVSEQFIHDRVAESYPLSAWLKHHAAQDPAFMDGLYILKENPLNIDDSRHMFYTLRASMQGYHSGMYTAHQAPENGRYLMADSYASTLDSSLLNSFELIEKPAPGYALYAPKPAQKP